MFLLIGHESDPCCRYVAAALRDRGQPVLLTPEPLAGAMSFTWRLDPGGSTSTVQPSGQPVIDAAALRGVLVRARGGPVDPAGWVPEDLAYARAEAQAALLAWLWTLRCPGVNRLSADLWFRRQQPLLEWRALLQRCGLPAPAVQITNDLAAARRFAARRAGAVTYAPLTVAARYPVDDDRQWSELAGVLSRLPVCLLEPCDGRPSHGCVVGRQVIWDSREDPTPAERAQLAPSLRRLAAELGLTTLEIELRRVDDGGLRCVDVAPDPRLDRYDVAGQQALVAALVEALAGAQ